LRHLPRRTVQRPQVVGKVGFEEAPELAGLGAGQDAGFRQTSHRLRVHLQKSGGFIEVQGVHWGGAVPWFIWFSVRDLPPEINGGHRFALMPEFLTDGEAGSGVDYFLCGGKLGGYRPAGGRAWEAREFAVTLLRIGMPQAM